MRSVYSVAWCTLLLSGLAAAPAVARADAAGNALLQQCIDMETKTRSLQADFTIQTKQGGRAVTTRGSLKLQKPNLARMTVFGGPDGDEVTYASDGKKFFTYIRADNEFKSEAADPSGGNVGRKACLEATTFFYPDTLNQLSSQGTGVKITGNATIGGVVCKELKVTGGAPGSSLKLFIGPDHLLYGISRSFGSEEGTSAMDSRLTNLKTSALPTAAFAWTLPKGAKPFQERVANTGPSSGTSPEESALLKVGSIAPDFQLPQTDGSKVSLLATAKAHKVIVLNFWSYFCGPCREELPYLNKMLAELKDRGFDIITVNSGDDIKVVQKFWKENHLNLRAAYNGDKVAEKFHIQAIPTNYVIGSDGRILANFEGFDEDGLRQALAKAGVK
jgi:peroxiredoxin/outer membrane lipoprotein-sorting protein